MNDSDIDDELRRFGRSIRADAATVDVHSALQAARERAGQGEARPVGGGRRRMLLVGAGTMVAVLTVSAAVWLSAGDDTAVRSVDSSLIDTTAPTTASPSTQPAAPTVAAVPTSPSTSASTQPTITSVPTTAEPTTTAATTTDAPAIDPFASATAVAATDEGVLLGLPDGTWAPSDIGAFGTALLIDRRIVFQAFPDPATNEMPSIEIHSSSGSTDLDDIGPARLFDVAWVGGAPFALVSEVSDEGNGWHAESLQLVDLHDLSAPPRHVADVDAVEGMRYAVEDAALANDRIVMIGALPTGAELVVMTLDGDVLYRQPLDSQVGYAPTASGDEAWLWGLRFAVSGGTVENAVWSTFLDVMHIDLETMQITSSSTPVPPSDSYSFQRFDGSEFGYASETEQLVFEPATGAVVERPDLPMGIISSRRDHSSPAG